MATIALARITNINIGSTDPTKFDVSLNYIGVKSGQAVSVQPLTLTDVDPTITNLTWEAALKQAVRTELINNFGYSFGLFDNVRLVGETLL